MRKIRTIPMDKDNMSYGSMKEVVKKIQEGIPMVVFPEGTRGDGSSFLEPEPGAAFLALKFGLPVLPAYVKGTKKAMPKGIRSIRMRPVSVFYGKPRKYQMLDGCDKGERYKKVVQEIMGEIKALKERYGAQD